MGIVDKRKFFGLRKKKLYERALEVLRKRGDRSHLFRTLEMLQIPWSDKLVRTLGVRQKNTLCR